MPRKYILTSNDNFSIPFSEHELEYCNYAKNILTDLYGNWIETDENLVLPLLNRNELGALRIFLQTRKQFSKAPQIREQPPIVTTCPVDIPTDSIQPVYTLLYWPAIISTNIINEWNTYNTGLPKEYHDFMLNTLHRVRHSPDEPEGVTMERWIQFASFLGCDDLGYILQARFAWCLVEALEQYPRRLSTQYIFERNHFRNSIESQSTIIDDEHRYLRSYLDVFADMRLNNPELAKYIVLKFLQHHSAPMPREEWTRRDWMNYRTSVEGIYRYVCDHEGS
jgi:hypothetical protein